MGKILIHSLIEHLERLKVIYKEAQTPSTKILELEMIILELQEFQDVPITNIKNMLTGNNKEEMKSNKKLQFSEVVYLLFTKRYKEIKGTKINYELIDNSDKVLEYVKNTPRKKILSGVTKLDLQLLYCLLTGQQDEIKRKNKNDILDVIDSNIHARKRGQAFSQMNDTDKL